MSGWTEEAVERLRELALQNNSANKIADALGEEFGLALTRSAVIGKVNRENIPLSRVNQTRFTLEEIVRRRRDQCNECERRKRREAGIVERRAADAERKRKERVAVPTAPRIQWKPGRILARCGWLDLR